MHSQKSFSRFFCDAIPNGRAIYFITGLLGWTWIKQIQKTVIAVRKMQYFWHIHIGLSLCHMMINVGEVHGFTAWFGRELPGSILSSWNKNELTALIYSCDISLGIFILYEIYVRSWRSNRKNNETGTHGNYELRSKLVTFFEANDRKFRSEVHFELRWIEEISVLSLEFLLRFDFSKCDINRRNHWTVQ